MKKFTMIKTLIIVLMILMSFVVVGEVRADDTLYAVDGARGNPASLHILDATTGGVIQTIGPTGFDHLTGIAFHPDTCVLYGVTSDCFVGNPCGGRGIGDLITIDLNTGAGTLVGNHSALIPDIDFDSTGTLYGWVEFGGSGGGNDDLYTIDITTGVETLVGFANFGTAATGLAFDSFDNLFVKSFDLLFSVDASTGLSTGLIGLNRPQDNALAFDSNDIMYSISRRNVGGGAELSTIVPGTGLVTVVGTNNLEFLSAIAFQKCGSIEFNWDAKLCSLPNAFNCKRTKGVVPVTIFGSADLDVTDIDISSLRLALADDPSMMTGAPQSEKPPADRGSPVDVDTTACINDITANTDGILDLDVGFNAEEVGILIGCADLSKGDLSPELILKGTLLDGTPLDALNVQVLTNVRK